MKGSGFQKVKTAKAKNIYVGKVPCPECRSLNTRAASPAATFVGSGAVMTTSSLIAFSISLWIPILGWIMLIPFGVGILLGLAMSVMGAVLMPFMNTLTFRCADCGSVQKIKNSEYKALVRDTAAGQAVADVQQSAVGDNANPVPPTPEAGWKADPTGRHEMRFWDGAAWTDHVTDAGVPSADVLTPSGPI